MNESMGRIEAKLAELGFSLPPLHKQSKPNRTGAVQVGNLLFVSGHRPATREGSRIFGKVGGDMGIEEAYKAAEGCALNMLSSIRNELGTLDRVRRVVKILGFINSAAGFKQQPVVLDGASDLFYRLWGDGGCHSRSATGMFELPGGIAVEVEGVFEIEP